MLVAFYRPKSLPINRSHECRRAMQQFHVPTPTTTLRPLQLQLILRISLFVSWQIFDLVCLEAKFFTPPSPAILFFRECVTILFSYCSWHCHHCPLWWVPPPITTTKYWSNRTSLTHKAGGTKGHSTSSICHRNKVQNEL